MPLSEHEQHLLDQIERALYAEDPKFASTVSSTDLRRHARRRMYLGIVALIVGLVALPVGVMIKSVVLGVAGFCLMFLAAVYVLTQYKRVSGPRADGPAGTGGRPTGKPRGKVRKQSLLQRMEERFRRRFDG